MSFVWGYSDFLNLLEQNENLRRGIIVDTNVLISATYDFDPSFDSTAEFLDLLSEHQIPLFCNVNVRSEFLEIHRRIIFTEALLSFEATVQKSKLPLELSKKLSSLRANQSKREQDGRSPLRLSESELKMLKLLMLQESDFNDKDLWTALCEERIGSKLLSIWQDTVDRFGLNFLSLRKEDQAQFIETAPEWEKAVNLMGSQGLSSSDAMIVNMFLSSNFTAILSSDTDVAIAIHKIAQPRKICFVPDEQRKKLSTLL